MLGIALHPAFERRPWVYLYFSDAESGRNVLVRVPEADGRAGEPQLLRSFLPWAAGYHNGGDLLFGPDGMLYVAVGEGHDASRAQDPDDVGGKILRLEPDGTIPPDNPIDGSAAYTIGHRNSFGLCIDPATGDIWETENGPDVDDEVNVLRAGENYGWPEVTGDSGGRFADPVVVFPRPEALTGCAVWRGELWFGAANTGVAYRMPLDGRGIAPREAASLDGAVTDLAVGPDGALYVATNAAIHRLTDDSANTTDLPSQTATETREPASPTVGPGPVEMPTPEDRDGTVPAAVPIGAAVVLAIALWMRLRGARSIGRSLDEGDPPRRS